MIYLYDVYTLGYQLFVVPLKECTVQGYDTGLQIIYMNKCTNALLTIQTFYVDTNKSCACLKHLRT